MITTESAMTQKFRGFSHSRNHHAIVAVIRGKSPCKTQSPPEQATEATLQASLAGGSGQHQGPQLREAYSDA